MAAEPAEPAVAGGQKSMLVWLAAAAEGRGLAVPLEEQLAAWALGLDHGIGEAYRRFGVV